jgi:predicted RNA-binding Zn-ribbon protein involved in translation (DUF1610 family)
MAGAVAYVPVRRGVQPLRAVRTMPYEICRSCHLVTYSAMLWSSVGGACPRCGARLEKDTTSRRSSANARMLGRCRQWLGVLPRRPPRRHLH